MSKLENTISDINSTKINYPQRDSEDLLSKLINTPVSIPVKDWSPVKDKVDKVEVLIKLLGTMVMEPQYESDPTTIGKKHFTGSLQVPIIKDENLRKVVTDKIMELVNLM